MSMDMITRFRLEDEQRAREREADVKVSDEWVAAQQTDAQLAEDDAAILAAAVALCWHARPALSVGEAFYHATPQEWWERQPEMERRLHIGRARVACEAWEMFWKERGR
jgi:hypothetical protein